MNTQWLDKGGNNRRHVLVDEHGEILAEVTRDSWSYDWHFKERKFVDLSSAQVAAEHTVKTALRSVS